MSSEKELEEQKILSLIFKFSIPAIVGMVVNSIYNMVDRMFIGQYVGEDALAGLVIVFPIMMLLFSFASVVGAGGSALVSIKFGQKDYNGAQQVYGNMIALTVIIALAGMILGAIFMDPLLTIAGAKGEVFIQAKEYLSVILFGLFFQLSSFVLSSLLRSEAQPKLSMLAMVFAAVTNIILDAIFIIGFDWGTFGAALATVIGQAVGFLIPLRYFLSKKSILKLHQSNLRLKFDIIKQITYIGSSSFISTLGTSISAVVLNTALLKYGGDSAITALGAINSLYTLFIMPIIGIQQGLQPIIGYNHGANLRGRVLETVYKGMGIACGLALVVFSILMFIPEQAVAMFIDPNSPTMPIAIEGLKFFILMLPIIPINFIAIAFFQSTGYGKLSLFLGLARQFIFLIPLIYILPTIFGTLTSVWIVTPIADCLSIILAVILLFWNLKKNKV